MSKIKVIRHFKIDGRIRRLEKKLKSVGKRYEKAYIDKPLAVMLHRSLMNRINQISKKLYDMKATRHEMINFVNDESKPNPHI